MSAAALPEIAFSPEGYDRLLAALFAAGYVAKGYADAVEDRRHVILRHDVDFSLAAAVALAEHEARRGVAATYFVLLRTEFYNPLSGEGLAALRHLADLGHAIGLHFDAALYSCEIAALEAAAAREADVLALALGRGVDAVSFHRPGKAQIPAADRFGGRINAYAARFFAPDRYCSDSRGGWHSGHPLDHPAIRAGRALQLLTHPFWWQAPALPPAERLRRFLAERAELLDRELARHCSVHVSR